MANNFLMYKFVKKIKVERKKNCVNKRIYSLVVVVLFPHVITFTTVIRIYNLSVSAIVFRVIARKVLLT